tara:strand:- start:621 stop:758 length:138 start_codon:yes stop_codon:yes gene_type:complete
MMAKSKEEIAQLFAKARQFSESENWAVLPKKKMTAKRVRKLGGKK